MVAESPEGRDQIIFVDDDIFFGVRKAKVIYTLLEAAKGCLVGYMWHGHSIFLADV